MMRLAEKQEIESATVEGFGVRIDVSKDISDGNAFALYSDAGVAIFVKSEPRTYKITLALVKGAKGPETKRAINDSFAWMFMQTDAQRLVGFIDNGNKACLAMVPQTYGYTLTDVDGGKLYTVTRKGWEAERPAA